MAKGPCNIADILDGILDGESIEALLDEASDPGANFSHGQLAKIGGAFEALGKHFTEAAKCGLEGEQAHEDGGVIFKWRDPHTQTRVDAGAVKDTFPQDEYPELYTESTVAGSVSVELPFDKTKLRLS